MSNRLSISSSHDSEIIKEHNKHVIKPPTFTSRAILKYFGSRFTSLFVPKSELAQYTWSDILNPFEALSSLSLRNWCYFLLAFIIWTFDALDYFAVSLNMVALSEYFDRSVSDLSWSISLVLFLRSVGAFIFGYMGEMYGRRWPLMINLFILCVLQIGTGFVKDYQSFLGVRALFGCFMGGIFGNAAAYALEDCPIKARGVVSGIFQQGYAFGYLLAVIFTRAIVDNSPYGWRSIFWFSSGPPFLMILGLYLLRETEVTQKNLIKRKESNTANTKLGEKFTMSNAAKDAFKRYWLIFVYLVLMMAGFNFSSHGSQDLYPTMLTAQKGFGKDRSTVTNCVANLGAMAGGLTLGHLSSFVGRRLTVMISSVLGGVCIYGWAFSSGAGINAGAFFLQFFVQGSWAIVPIHLAELSPPLYRSLILGLSYQLGNLASGASSTIESTIGERFPITVNGESAYDYATVMSIFMGCVFGYLILIMFVGPENRGTSLDGDRDEKIEDEFAATGVKSSMEESITDERLDNDKRKEKVDTQHLERV